MLKDPSTMEKKIYKPFLWQSSFSPDQVSSPREEDDFLMDRLPRIQIFFYFLQLHLHWSLMRLSVICKPVT